RRILILPVWKGITDDMYQLFIGHEVGHALFTPAEGMVEACVGKLEFFGDILQVVEDARIDKKIKFRFPGIGKNYRRGMVDMCEVGMFKVPTSLDEFYKEGKIDPMTFLDRLLLETKVAKAFDLSIPFTEEEFKLSQWVNEAETFSDTVDVSEEIYEYLLR